MSWPRGYGMSDLSEIRHVHAASNYRQLHYWSLAQFRARPTLPHETHLHKIARLKPATPTILVTEKAFNTRGK
jgi:hypothetical protein